jgi:hypothetical protein
LKAYKKMGSNVRRKHKVVPLPKHHACKTHMEAEVKNSSASCGIEWSTLASLPWEWIHSWAGTTDHLNLCSRQEFKLLVTETRSHLKLTRNKASGGCIQRKSKTLQSNWY